MSKAIEKALALARKISSDAFEEVCGFDGSFPHVPSGSIVIDAVIGDVGGYPKGRITEIFGDEGTGKTTLLTCGMVEDQRQGGRPLLLDFEQVYDLSRAQKLGLDLSGMNTPEGKFFFLQPPTFEEGWAVAEKMIESGEITSVWVDSIPAAIPRAMIEKELEDGVQKALQAARYGELIPRLVGKLARYGVALVAANQTRDKFGDSGFIGESFKTPGGRAWKFYASLRLRLSVMGKYTGQRLNPLTGKEESVAVANRVRVVGYKNKIGIPYRAGEFLLFYDRGVDNFATILDMAIARGVIVKSGAWYSYKGDKIGHGRDQARDYLEARKDVAMEIVRSFAWDVSPGDTASGGREG
jgi:recombination protein RecA